MCVEKNLQKQVDLRSKISVSVIMIWDHGVLFCVSSYILLKTDNSRDRDREFKITKA